jgi:dUTP pyrophosphatase
MDMKIRRFDKSIPLPEYKTSGAVAMDLALREGATIPPHQVARLPLNVAIKPPAGHFVLLAARSSLYKRGLAMRNGVGIFDEDYTGDNDEYQALLYNFTDEDVRVEKGDRVAQIVVIPYVKVTLEEVDSMGEADRGGFGTTGL